MTDEEAERQLWRECPRKILGFLHANGNHLHFTTKRFPGKVLCFQRGGEVPHDCVPTEAQAHFLPHAEMEAHGATG